MRTTVTLDADVERLLRDAMRASDATFKETINRAIREGLSPRTTAPPKGTFRVRARPMGLRAGIDGGSLNRLVDELEVEATLEKHRRRK